jgi:hypothetical protein
MSCVMANVKLEWDSVKFVASDVTGWISFRKCVGLNQNSKLLSSKAVYVIRVKRPLAFDYRGKISPVAYIGRGHAKQRITSHLKSWISEISKRIHDVKIEIFFCEPKIQRLGKICDHVEADLLNTFNDEFGMMPLRNRNLPKKIGNHKYVKSELKILRCGQGRGFHWAIKPLPSSPFFRRGAK